MNTINTKTVTILSQNLKKIRLVHHLTQHDFASILHKHRVYICELENASRNPSFETIYKISFYIKIPLSTLLAPCTCRILEQYPKLAIDFETNQDALEPDISKDINILVGHVIKEKRKKKHFSQNKLAELANVHRVHISNIECGKTSPTLKLLDTISASLGCETWELMEDLPEQSLKTNSSTNVSELFS